MDRLVQVGEVEGLWSVGFSGLQPGCKRELYDADFKCFPKTMRVWSSARGGGRRRRKKALGEERKLGRWENNTICELRGLRTLLLSKDLIS